MADQVNTSDLNRFKSIKREESENDNVDNKNPDDEVADDIDDDEADADVDTNNELDESGRDDQFDDDDDDDEEDEEDMDVDNESNMNDQTADLDGDDVRIEKDQGADTTATTATRPDVSSLERDNPHRKGVKTETKSHPRKGMGGSRGGVMKKRNSRNSNGINSRTPSVRGLTIPFRTIKKSMKLDPDIPIVQNEAAIMATVAVELFLKRLVTQSHRNAKNRGRNTVRYEDVAETRTKDKALAFLETMLP
jgi:histone H3/H4